MAIPVVQPVEHGNCKAVRSRKMKRNLKLVLIAGMFAGLLSGGLWTQEHGRPGGPPAPPDAKQVNKMVVELTQALSLTVEQQDSIRKLFLAHFEEVRALARKSGGDRKKQHRLMDAKRKEFEKAVNAILSDEQKVGFKEFMSKRGQRSERRPGRR